MKRKFRRKTGVAPLRPPRPPFAHRRYRRTPTPVPLHSFAKLPSCAVARPGARCRVTEDLTDLLGVGMNDAGDEWMRLKALFARAVELPCGQRDAWLQEQCADAPALLVEVR